MCDFCEYYFEGDAVNLTEAMSAKNLMAMTEPKRQFRGDVDIIKKKLQIVDKDGNKKQLERLDYIVKAKNSTEKKTHWGFIDIDPTNNNVEKLWCSCLDFATRFQIPFYKKGMSLVDVDPKYHKQELIRKGIHKNNGEWPKKMNPDGDLSLCKHLYFVIKYHLPEPKKVPEKKLEPIKVPEKKIEEPKVEPKKELPIKVEPKPIINKKEVPKKEIKEPEKKVVEPKIKIEKPKTIEKDRTDMKSKVVSDKVPEKKVIPPKIKIEKPKADIKVPEKKVVEPKIKIERPKISTKPTEPIAPSKKLQGKIEELPIVKNKTQKK